MHRHENDLPSEYNEGESAVTPMEVDKSLIDENLNAQNKPEEEKAEHVHVTSPCCSHIITEMEEGPGQAITEAGTSVKNVVADKSDAEHCLTQDPKDPEAENQGHFAVATEVNQGTDSSLQGDGQEEQLNNAHATDAEHLGNLTGSTDSDLPAPEKIKKTLAHVTRMQETITLLGKKRTFTESTLTAESLNSVESVGLIQSKRTADDDDDLLSSILVGKSSFLKMRATPVLEKASTKRLRAAPRSTAPQRRYTGPTKTLKTLEGANIGMSVELVSLHNEPYDLRGIMIIENDERHHSVGVVEEGNECSVRDVEETATEESSDPQVLPNDSEEQTAEAHTTHAQDQQTIDQQEEVKDDNEHGGTCDLEVSKENNGAQAAVEVNLAVNDEISQPYEDKLDHVEVEGCHENHDGGLGSRDVCDVIEIAEGDVDNNATFNETDLKVEDELPREDKKTDASAEVSETGIDDQTPCRNTVGSVETGCAAAGDFSNPAVGTCNDEPLAEANNDGVNPDRVC
ncbi:Sister chromatid cohesion 1 protein 4 [Raphanus sativus]|nr:Sister chromatid cohesion 1 protein 4 [Raphanus sativus]